jgi:hypothetical protein
MAEAGMGPRPADWQITATTISCDRVDDYVTVMVKGDWTCSCTWYNRYKMAADGGSRLSRDSKSKTARCQGPQCSLVLAYRDKLIAEETAVNK